MTILFELDKLIQQYPKIAEILRDCPYTILKSFEIQTYSKGEFYLEKGTISNEVYIIVDGLVDIFIESNNGKRVSLDIYQSGNIIGEHEIIHKNPFSVSVMSLSNITILKLQREQFLKWLDLDRNFSKFLIESLCSQLYKLSQLTEVYSIFSTKEQVSLILSKLNTTQCIERSQLLLQVSSTPRSVDRILKDLREKNIISNDNGLIRVINHEKLFIYGRDV
ncbi:Crp/Fnr family transcriptional regulator [Vagococcus silagei]|nr:Crp/Fnr family transcriptional regulator [Vagococcus silagei]